MTFNLIKGIICKGAELYETHKTYLQEKLADCKGDNVLESGDSDKCDFSCNVDIDEIVEKWAKKNAEIKANKLEFISRVKDELGQVKEAICGEPECVPPPTVTPEEEEIPDTEGTKAPVEETPETDAPTSTAPETQDKTCCDKVKDFAEQAFDYLDANDSGKIMPCDFIKLAGDAIVKLNDKVSKQIENCEVNIPTCEEIKENISEKLADCDIKTPCEVFGEIKEHVSEKLADCDVKTPCEAFGELKEHVTEKLADCDVNIPTCDEIKDSINEKVEIVKDKLADCDIKTPCEVFGEIKEHVSEKLADCDVNIPTCEDIKDSVKDCIDKKVDFIKDMNSKVEDFGHKIDDKIHNIFDCGCDKDTGDVENDEPAPPVEEPTQTPSDTGCDCGCQDKEPAPPVEEPTQAPSDTGCGCGCQDKETTAPSQPSADIPPIDQGEDVPPVNPGEDVTPVNPGEDVPPATDDTEVKDEPSATNTPATDNECEGEMFKDVYETEDVPPAIFGGAEPVVPTGTPSATGTPAPTGTPSATETPDATEEPDTPPVDEPDTPPVDEPTGNGCGCGCNCGDNPVDTTNPAPTTTPIPDEPIPLPDAPQDDECLGERIHREIREVNKAVMDFGHEVDAKIHNFFGCDDNTVDAPTESTKAPENTETEQNTADGETCAERIHRELHEVDDAVKTFGHNLEDKFRDFFNS